jgi:hypothetical protein
MTALLSLKWIFINSTFYQKRKQSGTAGPLNKRDSIPEEHFFARTYSVVKELTV